LTAKSNRRYPKNPIPVDYVSEVHLRLIIHNFYLVPNSNQSKFVLREESPEGNALVMLNIWLNETFFAKFRKVEAQIPPGPGRSEYLVLMNRQPEIDKTGVYLLSFYGKIAIPSQKNTMLIEKEKNNSYDFYALRRISLKTFEVDSYQHLDLILVFGIALECINTGV
jgi:hypothetical protein